ncbi:hypothetical protein G0Q06_06075 [Puniceicoccales bacterium CK1056]|uniref:Uncharacterized protein n=1 Tax=Oceanipulchritudo coccoides TaxID=2706888 RepID=A0A6B2M0T9_9BACT|nr:Ig-like domain repeat protein [Oceanipulchritudo coccoides]NDV62012.1 hypothetical protein [Oceanipulchritudo coccoides]
MKNSFKILCPLVLSLVLQTVQAVDTAAPLLTSISVSPASVDASGGDQIITATLTITDDESGLNFGNIFLYNPSGTFVDAIFFNTTATYLTSGTATNGTYEVQATVPQYATPGTWEVRVFLRDNLNQDRRYGGTNEAFPNPGDEDFTVVNGGTVDSTSPGLVSVSVSPALVDTGSGPANLTVSLNITDDLSGFESGSLEFYDPSGTYRSDLTEFFYLTDVLSGDALDGDYEITLNLPAASASGLWTIEFFIRDRLGNSSYLVGEPGAEFTVTNVGGASGDLSDAVDATQYPLAGFGSPEWFFQTNTTYDGIDAAQSGAIGDNESTTMEMEFNGPGGTLTFWWKVDSEDGFDFLSVDGPFGFYDEISGDVDWVQVTVPIPSGIQTVSWTYFKDSGGSAGADAGWVDRVYYSSLSDNEDPVLQYINISPNPVDVSTGDQTVTITVEVSDDFNGVSEGYISLWDPDDFDYDYLFFDSSNLVSGDAYFGTYEVSTILYESDFFPTPFAALGTWRAEVEIIEDNTFNSRYYGPFDDPFPNPGDELFTVGDGLGGGAAPILESIDPIGPVSADFSAGGQIESISFRITDSSDGFSYGYIYLYAPGGGFVSSTYFDGVSLTSGDEFDGTYSVNVSIPQYAPSGTWSLAFSLFDFANNFSDIPFETAFQNPGEELFTVTNSGTADTADPVLQSIVVSPAAIDTTTSAQSIDVTLTISEDLSGLSAVNLYVYDPLDTYINSLYTFFPGDDQLGGVFSTTLEIPQGSLEGTWEFATIIYDNVGNSARHGIFWDPFPVPGDEEFTVGPVSPSTFDNFVSLYSLSGPDALLNGNPDGDWYINALELVLGTDPTVWDAMNASLLAVETVGGELRLTFTVNPALTIGSSGNFLQFSDGGGGAPLNLTGQTSALLNSGWVNVLPTLVSGTTYRVSLTISPGEVGFMRLDFN